MKPEIGPIELLVVNFPGNNLRGEILAELQSLVEQGTIRILDLIFARRDRDGNVAVLELNDLDDDDYAAFDTVVSDELSGTLTEDDARQLAAALEPNSSAGILLFENTWATKLQKAIQRANGRLITDERVPAEVVEQIMAL